MEEPGRLQSMGSQRVGHDWATSLSLWHSTATNVTSLVIVTHVAKASFIFKVCFSLLLYFQVQWLLFLFSPLCYWAHPLIFLFWLLYLFVFIVFVCIYLYLLYLFVFIVFILAIVFSHSRIFTWTVFESSVSSVKLSTFHLFQACLPFQLSFILSCVFI